MTPNPWRGSFFVFDGIDGCGKSEQLCLAKVWLKTIVRHQTIVSTKEPNKDGPWGKKIYEELKKAGGWHEKNPLLFQSWYAQDSLMNYRERIVPSLKSGLVVLSDRGRSSMVYGCGDENDLDRLMCLNAAILGEHFIWPDAFFIFDVGVETAMARLQQKNCKPDQHERRGVLLKVKSNFVAFADRYPNCHLINAERRPEAVFQEVQKIIAAVLKSKNKP